MLLLFYTYNVYYISIYVLVVYVLFLSISQKWKYCVYVNNGCYIVNYKYVFELCVSEGTIIILQLAFSKV